MTGKKPVKEMTRKQKHAALAKAKRTQNHWSRCTDCGRRKKPFNAELQSTGPLCASCRKGKKTPKMDALDRCLPGSFETGKRR